MAIADVVKTSFRCENLSGRLEKLLVLFRFVNIYSVDINHKSYSNINSRAYFKNHL